MKTCEECRFLVHNLHHEYDPDTEYYCFKHLLGVFDPRAAGCDFNGMVRHNNKFNIGVIETSVELRPFSYCYKEAKIGRASCRERV